MCFPFQIRRAIVIKSYDSLKNYGLLQRRAAAVAQRVTRWTSNSDVVSSRPISGVYKSLGL